MHSAWVADTGQYRVRTTCQCVSINATAKWTALRVAGIFTFIADYDHVGQKETSVNTSESPDSNVRKNKTKTYINVQLRWESNRVTMTRALQ